MNDAQAQEMLRILTDTRALLQLAMRDRLAEVRDEVFSDSSQTAAFRLFHAGKTYREIGEGVGVSHATVGRWVDGWKRVGLVHPTDARCLITPDALGI